MEWIVTTARTVEEAQVRALDLLGVDLDDAEVQIIEEGKTGLFGRTKTEARVRARIKPKAPPAKEDRRQGRNDRNRNRNRNRGGRGGQNKGGNNRGGQGRGNQPGSREAGVSAGSNKGGKKNQRSTAKDTEPSQRQRSDGGGRNRSQSGRQPRQADRAESGERIEMPVAEQRETLETFVQGVARVFDATATVELVEEGTTLQAKVSGEDLGRLIGQKASTLQTFEELARTAMHRAAEGRRYHRIQLDVDNYRGRRRQALLQFATDLAESVAASGQSKAMEPMGAADRKLIHDAVADVAGVETVSEGRDPRRYIVILPLAGSDEEE